MMTTQKLDDLYEIATENGITIYEDCPESIVAMAAKYPSGKRVPLKAPTESVAIAESKAV